MEVFKTEIVALLKEVLREKLEPKDRISLILFSKSCETVFQLVYLDYNFEQLENQICSLVCQSTQKPNCFKAIYYAVKQWQEHGELEQGKRQKWIIILTN